MWLRPLPLGECHTCGGGSRTSCDLCGQCAEDWQTPKGRERIERRRKKNHLLPLSGT